MLHVVWQNNIIIPALQQIWGKTLTSGCNFSEISMAFQFFTTGSGYQMRTCNYLLTVQGVLVSVLTLLEKWAYGSWPQSWVVQGIIDDITVLELFPLLVSLHIWGEHLRNKTILFRVDNFAVVQIVNSMTSKSDRVMSILRAFTLLCLKLNIAVKAQHLSGCLNRVVDSLSRLQFQKFRELVPDAEPTPTPVPNRLWNIFS